MKIRNKKAIIVLILCVVMFVFTLLGTIYAPKVFVFEYDESNTVQYSGMVEKVEKDKNLFSIHIADNDYTVYFHSSVTVCDTEYILALTDKKIYFRIDGAFADLMDKNELTSIGVVTLSTEETEIVTFNASNKIKKREENTLYIICIVLTVVFFLCAVSCALNMFGITIFKKKNSN